MRFTDDDLKSILARLERAGVRQDEPQSLPAVRAIPIAIPQPAAGGKPSESAQGEARGTTRVRVRITSRRRRFVDADNLCAKFVVDCLRYAGVIRNDDPGTIDLELAQEKVSTPQEEGTLIEIFADTYK